MEVGTLLPIAFDLSASSIMTETSLGGMTELVDGLFLLWGFIDGDCLTVRLELFDTEAAFRFDFRGVIELELTVGVLNSTLASTGDVVSEVSELRTAP